MKRSNSPDKNNRILKRVVILTMAIIAALALALTFALGFDGARRASVDNAEQGEIKTSATNRTPTIGTTTNYASTALVDGDTFTFTGTGNYYGVTLPVGKYNLEVWGAQGGTGTTTTILGGYGGYAKATYTITSTTTLYIYVGGKGVTATATQNAVTSGGYNGGGQTQYRRTCSHRTGSGGGATHIATASGLLSSLSGNTGAVLIVGGGGGGGGYAATTAVGGSGGPSGGSATYSASYTDTAGGGTTSGGGVCSNGTTHWSSFTVAGSAGSFGQGGAGGSVASGAGGAGGGGGYYGGAGGYTTASCNGGPAGGGCNYIKSGLTVLSNTTQTAWTGDGKAVITVINQPPTGNNYSATLGTRASGSSTTISVNNLATDPDTNKTALAFSDGTSGAYDTYSKFTTNSGLYLDSACTVSASKYFSWTTSGNTSFTIKPIKYPRAGQTGVTATSTTGNTVTLYTKIRDTYGTGTSTRACSTISFTLKVPRETITQNSAPNATVVNSAGTASTIGCLVGASAANAPAHGDPTAATASSIYNPNGGGVQTLFVKQTLMLGGKITISAANLLSGFSTTYDQAVISIPDTSKITGASRLFKVTQVDSSTDKVASIPASGSGSIANAFSQISLECVTPTPGYQFLPVTVYLVEKAACNGTNVALWDTVTTQSYSFQVVFKMENTRPVLKSGVSNIVNVGVGTTTALKLGTYFSDIDNSAGITSATHTITDVIVPKNEFIALDRLENTVALASPNASYYNKGTKKSDAFTSSAQTSTTTEFKDNIVYYTTSPGSINQREAFMSYTYSGDTLTVTGLRASFSQYTPARANAPGHFYLMLHIKDNCDALDNGIWLPLAFTVGDSASNSHKPLATVTAPHSVTAQTAVTTFPTAAGAVGDSFYFAPMAINYSGSHVVGKYRAADANGNNTGALTSDGLQPLAIDGDSFATTNGLASWGSYGATANKLNDLLLLSATPESVVKSVCPANECKQISANVWENQYFKAEYLPIYIEKNKFATSVFGGGRVVVGSGTNANGYYFVTLADSDDSDYYMVNGLKITLKSATMNRYVYAQAGVTDITGNGISNINIAVRVNNTALHVLKDDSGNVAKFGDPERDSAYSLYSYSADGDIPTFTYKIPLGGTVMITPYDFALDYDMTVCGVNEVTGGFTLNGYSGRYSTTTGMFTTGSTNAADGDRQFAGLFGNTDETPYNKNASDFLGSIRANTAVPRVSSGAAGTAANSGISTENVPRDRLFFDRTSAGTDAYTYNPTTFNNFYNSRANTTNFVDVNFGTKVKMGSLEYSVDFVMLTALNRTTQPAVIDLAIRDRYGNGSSDVSSYSAVRIIIEVVNTKPNVKNPAFYSELSVKPIGKGEDIITPNVVSLLANGNGNNTGIMVDHDSDVPEYMVSRGVAVVNKAFIDDFNANILVDAAGNRVDNLVFASFDNLNTNYTEIQITDEYSVNVTNYITAEVISRREITVKAISSTKAIAGGVYVVFFVTDNNGGTSLGYARIEVLNTAPVLNESDENGFNASNPLWYIKSASDADITRNRYIVGSDLAAQEINSGKTTALNNAALDIDIKLIAVDDDGEHNKTVLSQVSADTVNGKTEYHYSTLDMENITEDGLGAVVPNVLDGTSFGERYAAVTVFTRTTATVTNENGEYNVWYAPGGPNGTDDNNVVDLHFYVEGRWYSRAALIKALADGALDIEMCFDESGRFIVADWAL
ncbi:MAG: hypothetical protein K2O04_03845, partial [Clostridiales bacterium]|nr:hypothetical protein [Clostridiales bacterium]